jgi:hypothetical protein
MIKLLYFHQCVRINYANGYYVSTSVLERIMVMAAVFFYQYVRVDNGNGSCDSTSV